MRGGAGIFALMAVLAAGARIAFNSAAPQVAPTYSGTASIEPKAPLPEGTSCPAFAGPQAPKDAASPGELTTLVRQFVQGAPQQTKPGFGLLPKDTRFIVASVPDPLHTLLNLDFDRTIDAIQQAAQDQGYTYDSSWLPWKAQTTEYSRLADQNVEDQDTSSRELCPGLILFRNGGKYDDAYTHGLFVFLIGEKPTTGINQIQWNNAIQWINLHANNENSDHMLRVLGPAFSGSVTSVARALIDLRGQTNSFSNVLLYNGRVRGCSSIQWLKNKLNITPGMQISVKDFIQNDAIQVDRYFEFLTERGHLLSEVAVLNEDETAYGGLPDATGANPATCKPAYEPGNGPLHLYYPRDISALQSAYQEQSIFAPSTGNKSNTAHVVLQPQVTTSTHHDTDTVATFSGPNSALAQEAQMYGIVDSLKTHGIRYVILRSTNYLDYLFLTRFLHRAYPDAFVVTVGADMLFGREIDSTEFRGVQALTTFPLLPRGQDWTIGRIIPFRHAHRVFGSDTMEGTYVATRFLITDAVPSNPPDLLKADIPDYRAPFWEPQGATAKSSGTAAAPTPTSSDMAEPSTWLSVVGRDGYWPVAVLTKPFTSQSPGLDSTLENVTLPNASGSETTAADTALWKLSLSPVWKFCCGLALLAVCLHFYASFFGSRCENQSMFIQFVPLGDNRQLFLIGSGWATVASIVILMLRCSSRIGSFLEAGDSRWIVVLYVAAALACLGVVVDIASRSAGEPHSARIRALRAIVSIALQFVLAAGAYSVGSAIFEYSGPNGNGVPIAYRAVYLTNGVSPMISLLILLGGFYWWFWHTLSGLALLGEGRPILPREEILASKENHAKGLARISDAMAANIESRAIPLPSLRQLWMYLLPLPVMALPTFALWHHGPSGFDPIFHSLENRAFNDTLHALLALAMYLLIFECSQLMSTWLSLKRLLLALNRTPLRRTFSALQGLSMHSLWSLSGTSSRARYTIFSHQLESLFHLRNVVGSFAHRDCGNKSIRASIDSACKRGRTFVEERSMDADLAMINSPESRQIRLDFRQCVEIVLTGLILPAWLNETCSMDLARGDENAGSKAVLPLSEDEPTRHAEEFVCLIYVGYLQNLLARMRTMALSIIGVLASFAFSLAFYPYTPRPTIVITLLMLVAALGAAVALVYAGLERDSTLSRITNTEPGELGWGFWVRFGSFIGVPVLGLLVAQFPAITDFVTSWIEPSLNAAK